MGFQYLASLNVQISTRTLSFNVQSTPSTLLLCVSTRSSNDKGIIVYCCSRSACQPVLFFIFHL
jgi:hypothetical protein